MNIPEMTDDEIDRLQDAAIGTGPRRSRNFARAILAARDAQYAAQGQERSKGIPTEVGIAWQSGTTWPNERKAVTVDGNTWYRHDHPKVSAAQERAEPVNEQEISDRAESAFFAQDFYEEPVAPAVVETSTPQAFQTLKAAIQADEMYAWSWHCVAWSCAFDEGLETGAANRAAARFMSMAFDTDTSKHPHFKPEHQRAATPPAPAQPAAPSDAFREATWIANAQHDDGTVPWRNDPAGRPFKSNRDKPIKPIAAFGCDREVQGGRVCPHWCGQNKCGVVVADAQPSPEPSKPEQVEAPSRYAADWERFPAYLIDHCEGDIISEEGLQRALSDMLKDPKYVATLPPAIAAGDSGAGERSPADYAIEHAEYMAKDGERLIDAINDLARSESEHEDGTANESDVHAAIETLSEAQSALQGGIYEFRKRRDRAALATKPQAVAPVVAVDKGDGTLCSHCDGSGTVTAVTGHLGPDDYEYETQCPACWGTGSSDIRDAINALSYQPHSVTPGRQMVHRADVLRIIAARASNSDPKGGA